MKFIFNIRFSLLMFIYIFTFGHNQTVCASDVYDKLDEGKDVKVLILGDSIGMSSHATETVHSWTYQLEQHLKDTYGSNVFINNLSMNGNLSYSEYVRIQALRDGEDYDLAILCVGENDTEENFSEYYEAVIRALMAKYKNCSIISVLQSSQTYESVKIKNIIELCRYYNIPMADTILAFAQSGLLYEELSADGIHPNDTGYGIYANVVNNLIDDLVKNDNRQNMNEDILPLNGEKNLYTGFSYYSSKNFTYDGANAYDIDVSNVSGMIGLDFGMTKAGTKIEIYADDEFFAECVMNKSIKRYIFPVADDIFVKSHIKIVISDDEMAHMLCGMVLSGRGNPSVNDSMFLPTPKVISVKNTALGTRIRWEQEENVSGYIIYRKIQGSENYYKKGEVYSADTNEYVDMTVKSGKTYTYAVRAIKDDVPGVYEAGMKVTYIATPKPDLENHDGSVKISWKKINGATGYYVYRKEYGSGWKKIKKINKKTSTHFYDRNVEGNTMYIYRVQAFNSVSKSGKSDEENITYTDTPVIDRINTTKKGIKITWNEIDGADEYYIYRKTGAGSYKLIKKLKDADSITYTDKKVKYGKVYSYIVKAKIDGSLSYASNHKRCKYNKE